MVRYPVTPGGLSNWTTPSPTISPSPNSQQRHNMGVSAPCCSPPSVSTQQVIPGRTQQSPPSTAPSPRWTVEGPLSPGSRRCGGGQGEDGTPEEGEVVTCPPLPPPKGSPGTSRRRVGGAGPPAQVLQSHAASLDSGESQVLSWHFLGVGRGRGPAGFTGQSSRQRQGGARLRHAGSADTQRCGGWTARV